MCLMINKANNICENSVIWRVACVCVFKIIREARMLIKLQGGQWINGAECESNTKHVGLALDASVRC